MEILKLNQFINESYIVSTDAKELYDNYLQEKKYVKENNITNEDEGYVLDDEQIEEIKIKYGKEIKGFVDQIDVAIETYYEIKNKKDEETWYNMFNY